jgi:hypothetical protein
MKLTAVLPLVALSLALTAVVKTNDQQAQQTFINARDRRTRHSSWLISKSPV